MTTAENRFSRFNAWKDAPERNITFRAVGEALGVKTQSAHNLLKADTIPTRHHKKLVALGVPVDLLPEPEDKPRGPQPKVAQWPVSVHS